MKLLVGVTIIFVFFSMVQTRFGEAAGFSMNRRIDLAAGMDYERFLLTGKGLHMEKMFRRVREIHINEDLMRAIRAVDVPVTLVTYGSMSCPDCQIVVPYLQKMHELNPLVTTRYFLRDDESRKMLTEITGVSRIPTVFIADAEGLMMQGVFVEHPRNVAEAIQAARDNEEINRLVEDFRAAKYDDDVQSDLASLLNRGLHELRSIR